MRWYFTAQVLQLKSPLLFSSPGLAVPGGLETGQRAYCFYWLTITCLFESSSNSNAPSCFLANCLSPRIGPQFGPRDHPNIDTDQSSSGGNTALFPWQFSTLGIPVNIIPVSSFCPLWEDTTQFSLGETVFSFVVFLLSTGAATVSFSKLWLNRFQWLVLCFTANSCPKNDTILTLSNVYGLMCWF